MADYIFQEHQVDRETVRLKLLEEAFDGSTKNLLLKAGIGPGKNCLEVGAGGGSILNWMKAQVGEEGLVVGIDRNQGQLMYLAGKGLEIFIGDLLNFSHDSLFDVIHARYVLVHNKNAMELINHLKKFLNQDGVLVLEEPDFEAANWLDDTFRDAGNRVNQAMLAMFENMGLDPGLGRKLPQLLREIGFEVKEVQGQAHLDFGGGRVARVMGASAEALKETYLATGKADTQSIQTYIDASQNPISYAHYYTTVQIMAKNGME